MIVLLCAVVQGARAQNYDVWDGVTTTKPREINGVIHITNAAELAYLSANFNSIQEWGGRIEWVSLTQQKTVYDYAYTRPISLDADIDMGDAVSWAPLGRVYAESHYESTFYGNGHTIRIHTTGATDNYQGLFTGIASTGRVENLHVVADIHCSDSRLVGGIAGENDGTIENCWVSGTVRSDWKNSSVAATAKVGGICGENNGTVQYCCVTANVQNDDADVGGLVGCNDNTISHCTFYGTRSSTHDQDNIYAGDSGTEENCFGIFNQSEYNAASGRDVYCYALMYPYAINVEAVGYGTVQVSAGGENGITRWHPCTAGDANETVTLAKTTIPLRSVTVTDADGNNIALQGHANDNSSFWFVMPNKDVTATVYYDYANWPTEGAGTEADPYLISSADDWLFFANNVTVGQPYSGKVIKLTDDISVTTMAGAYQADDNYQPFSGTFDGDGHTLTINVSNQSRFAAPFKCVEGATIKNLRTAGTINGGNNADGKLLAGLVGVSFGNNTITGCVSHVTLTTDFGEDAALAGLVAGTKGGSLTIEGCVFDGSMTGASNTRCAGIVGYEYGGTTTTITNTLFAPSMLTVSTTDDGYTKTITRDADATITGCYYTQTLGTAQGTQCIPAVSIPANLGSPTADYGMVTAYQNGILCNGTFYGTFTTFSLANTSDNTSTIANNNGYLANVTLADRTLYKDGAWNTICLPFDVTISGSPLHGAVARPLTSASISGTTLSLTFGDAVTTLQAGTPYIIKWDKNHRPNFTAISGTNSGANNYPNLVDGNTNTRWQSNTDLSGGNPWVCVFKADFPITVRGYTLTTDPYNAQSQPEINPREWTLEAKVNSGDAWTVIDSRDVTTNAGDALPAANSTESQVYAIASGKQGQYQYFRFTVIRTGCEWMSLAELKLYGDVVSPVFNGVTIDDTDRSYDNEASGDAHVRFIGTYKSTSFTDTDNSILLMGGNNTLYYPTTGAGLGAQRAYFKIGSGEALARRMTAFNLNFGDGNTTGIISLTPGPSPKGEGSDYWYTLDGRRLSGKPSRAGVYINKGNKVVIK